MEYLWVGLGGAFGAVARFGVSQLASDRWSAALPYGTFLVNVTGSFAIGLIFTFLLDRDADPVWRLLVVTGFLGGYTTFSSYSFELVTLIGNGRFGWSALYLVASNLLGLAACVAGAICARTLALRF
jgi:CrcB protein